MAPNLYTPVIQRPYRIYLGSPARPLCSSDYNESFQWKHLRPSITFVPSFSSSDRGQAELLVKLMGRSKDKRPPSANRWRFEQCRDPLGIGRKRPVLKSGSFSLSFAFIPICPWVEGTPAVCRKWRMLPDREGSDSAFVVGLVDHRCRVDQTFHIISWLLLPSLLPYFLCSSLNPDRQTWHAAVT